MKTKPYRSQECGSCYGNGCSNCAETGFVSTQEDLDAFDDAMERRGEEERERRRDGQGLDDD